MKSRWQRLSLILFACQYGWLRQNASGQVQEKIQRRCRGWRMSHCAHPHPFCYMLQPTYPTLHSPEHEAALALPAAINSSKYSLRAIFAFGSSLSDGKGKESRYWSGTLWHIDMFFDRWIARIC